MLRIGTTPLVLIALPIVLATGCADRTADVDGNEEAEATVDAPTPEVRLAQSHSELAGTSWEMVQIQSMDDNSWAPEDPGHYTLTLEEDGTAHMRLDCNQGRTSWSSEGSPEIAFGPVASTSALCQDDGLSERYAAQFQFVRSYVLRDGHLFLATQADGAIIEFRPADRDGGA